ncbi:MBL fold metallo-hydrolase [Pseudomonas syringae]|uniref:MBL fold metallo-hydrolase n=1 Tax=Pseudomonas syringae TaxID=317 RepID=UPI001F0D9B8E|nr:MBL fold metallo-hydrolase [Pseudomonas syringae]MCH5487758.1 MBL fold metallo-hydrolase [Pseudomonas syringae pv. syringae]MDO1458901.1 MBL fold metallo-hydrolase [Pseudomonas syringae pv. syringae]
MIMKLTAAFALVFLATLNDQALAAQSEAERYAQKGLAAGSHFPGIASVCELTKPLKIAGQRPKASSTAPAPARQSPAQSQPMKVFDNLYFVGTSGVASWVIKTSEGLIVIDALNNDHESEKYIEGGLVKLGLDPKDIRYLLITHGHGDHYGGQRYIVDKYKPKVIMSELDWQELEKPKLEFSNPRWGNPPKRDIAVNDGEQLKLGDTTVELYVTPGHTPGTLSLFFPVYDNGIPHEVAFWGGTGLNFGPIKERIRTYSSSAERFRTLARVRGADIFMSNHPARDGALDSMKALARRKPGELNAFVAGATATEGAFALLRDCAYAQVLKIDGHDPQGVSQ